jgi:alkylhydroperoxidase family enzyme
LKCRSVRISFGDRSAFLSVCNPKEIQSTTHEEAMMSNQPSVEKSSVATQPLAGFRVHTLESAPEQSKPSMQGLQQKLGFVPNVAATMADSPVLLNAFVGNFVTFQGSGFNECEKQILLLTNAVTIKSPWTVAFHSMVALKVGVDDVDVQAVRNGQLPRDARFAALSRLTRALVEQRGNLGGDDLERFVSAGYSQRQVLEVIAGIGLSTMAATVGNLARTPLEAPLQAHAWSPA